MSEVLKRGQVWYFNMTNSYGQELMTGRPCVVLHDSDENEVLVTVMFMTTTPKDIGEFVELYSPKKKSWALPNQIQSYDKGRLKAYLCDLTDREMVDIDRAITKRFGIKVGNPNSEERLNELEKEVTKSKVTIDVYKKLYEEAVKMVVEQRLKFDTVVVPKVEEPKQTIVVDDIMAQAPIDVTALKEKFNFYDKRQAEKKAVSQEPRKANVNKDSAKTISELTGMSMTVCYSITGTRKSVGRYEKLEDLLVAKLFKEYHLKTYGHLLEV